MNEPQTSAFLTVCLVPQAHVVHAGDSNSRLIGVSSDVYRPLLPGALRQCPCQGCRQFAVFQLHCVRAGEASLIIFLQVLVLEPCTPLDPLVMPWYPCDPMLYRLMIMQKQYADPRPLQAQHTSQALSRDRWVLQGDKFASQQA